MTVPAVPVFENLVLGDIVAKVDLVLTRDDLVRYAGASGDMNPIHFNDAIATAAGLPGVLAHGMLTAGIALQAIVDWVGDPSGVISYETRFTRPVVVDAVDGADLSIAAKIARIDSTTRTVRIDVTVMHKGQTVLGKTQAHLQFPGA
ncbi:MaoC family dehydratase N-terminal domain-containing protein [Rhodococcus erythropolis]|uniref:MaoC/PaaZ C-terminal domain-containing protein n=1 Tax=Rhodococcus erythropolis TaxID=1833 RepID=UPI0002DC938A|nr:MaoC/PaaZ C-terminal domain-containing protein [Rhodococcus erythropolis]AKD99677.1 acyl dehydratase [Rhodococcus erythropolis]MCQ4122893.1 MaoC family dehydratase N-terminal domain-containing protein [Rhodococcus erythropolis]MCW0194822.1 MaoC/PaaZ C-terminal domain-containing protein [Rhodococcus sp. (in: high G+C Gram-positive bacteria)]MDN5546816.1 MaoC family dehydratase N-terminal domain-containing protein [Rhodococcus sp. (in: high G+C Gram-positive bacteria)]